MFGTVGGGGIALDEALDTFYWDKVGTVLPSIVAVVAAAALIVTQIRNRII